MDDVEAAFHARMLRIYQRADRELGYRATRFLQLVASRGGVGAARQLINGPPTDGLGFLLSAGRRDLTMEALMLEADYRVLFTEEELRLAEERVGS